VQAGATTAAHAQQLAGLPPTETTALEALLKAGVVREADPGAYYLDQPGSRPRWMTKRRLAGLVIVLAVALLLLVAVIAARSPLGAPAR